jgi:hypothetical protein
MTIKVLVVDDPTVVRDRLSFLLDVQDIRVGVAIRRIDGMPSPRSYAANVTTR